KPKPELTSSLKGAVLTGNSVTLYCTLKPQSAGWKFYWSKPTQSSETESHSYNISSVSVSDGGQYWCRAKRIKRVYYTDYSNELSLTVIESPKPTVTINPDTQVFIGETVTFRCDVQKGGDTEWTYDWFRENVTFSSFPTRKDFSISYVTDSHHARPKPVVSVQAADPDNVFTGETVTFSCEIKTGGYWQYHWFRDNNELSEAAGKKTFKISDVKKSNNGAYTCSGTQSSDPKYTQTSDAVTLTVSARPKPVVSVQAADPDNVFTGETVTFSCEIKTGGYWQYHWFRDNNELSEAAGKKTFTISDVKKSNNGAYTCRGTQSSDPKYTQTSDAVTLTVSEKPKPELTSSLKGAVLTGNSVTLYCTLKPQSAGWTFYWSKSTQSSETVTGSHSYNISPDSVSDGDQYRCRAGRIKRVYYTDYSNALSLTVIESPKPTVTINPDTQVFIGETVTFRCDVQKGRDTEWTYDWFRDNAAFYSSVTTQISISYVTDSHRGKYTCRGRTSDSQMSEMSDPVTLSVSENPKPELTSSLKGDVLTGNSVTLYCTLKPQSAGWKFYWSKYTWSHGTETETESDSYNISSVSVSDRGQYKCIAGRGNPVYYTHYSNPLSLTVIESPKPVVIIKPNPQVFSGETVTFRCNIQSRKDNEWAYIWNKKDYTEKPYKEIQEFNISVTVSDRGTYSCRGVSSDSQHSKDSDPFTLTVSEKPKPELTSDLKGAVLTGTSVTLYCTLKPHSDGWKFYWSIPTQSSETETETHHYFISSVRVSDGGQYKCRAGRGNTVYYTVYSDALWVKVTGGSPPVSLIISPNRTQHFTADSLSLSCDDQSDSTGWTVRGYTHNKRLFNCSSVSGSTCNISSLSTSHTGVYWCQSESGGRSNSVNITVHNGAVILDSPVHPVTAGRPLNLRCLYRSKMNPGSGVDFYKDDSILQNQTTGEMTISSVSKSDEGFYHCKHPERGESPKSWVSVRVSASRSTGVIIGLSLASVFVILMILLILLLHFKKKKGVQSQSPTLNQDTNQPADGGNVYGNTAIMTTGDSAVGSSNTIYSQVVARKKKQNDDAARGSQDVLYSQIEMKNVKRCNKDTDAESGDVTYAEIDLKKTKKPKRNQGKSSEGVDTVYSELKQNTDKGDFTDDVTYAQVMTKGKKNNAGNITKIADTTYAQVRTKGKIPGPL
ncbi:hypothetical protein QTP70_031232, partial [Hemibagrus guttatus]